MIWRWLNRLFGRSDIYIDPSSPYMRRWRIGPKRWSGLRLHHILRSDADRELHDHPFWFVSLILRGGYYEHRPDGSQTWYGPGRIVFRRAEDLHRLELGRDRWGVEVPAWTFVIRGPYAREWGFVTDDGWMPWWRFAELRRTTNTGVVRPYESEASL